MLPLIPLDGKIGPYDLEREPLGVVMRFVFIAALAVGPPLVFVGLWLGKRWWKRRKRDGKNA